MKKLLTFIAFIALAVTTVDAQASGPIPSSSVWTYDSGNGRTKLDLEFPVGTSLPVFINIVIQDEVTETPLDTISGAAMNLQKTFFVDGLAPNSYFRVIYRFENGDGENQYTDHFNTLVSAIAEPSQVLPRAYVAGNQIMVTNIAADQKVVMYDILGRELFQGTSSSEQLTIQKPTGVGPYCFIAIGNEQEKRLVLRVFIIP